MTFNKSAQVKLRAWIYKMPAGTEFTTADARAFLVKQGFAETQSGGLMTHMLRWWKLVERTKFGHYRKI